MRAAALVLAAAAMLAACEGGGSPQTSPTAAPTTPTGLFPSGLGSSFTGGSANVQLTGDLEVEYEVDLNLPTSIFNDAGAALSYADTSGRTLGLAGQFEVGGPHPTSSSLVLTITVVQPEITLFISQGGECQVTFDEADEGSISGSFECADLRPTSTQGGGPTVDATGTFEATA